MPLPKTSLTKKTILATYPNSRWQMDLKNLPACRGYNYACNIVDCFSRCAMGGPIKSKSATDVEVFTSCAYQYGPPRILQTDNGRELNNSHLNAVIDELKAMKINGRPYHPQSQGRVERFNQTLSNFLRRDLQNEKDWPSRLQYLYCTYNTRSSKSLKNHTPYDMFFKRPNFSLQTSQSRNNLSREEIEFLDMDHVPLEGGFDDVDGDVEDEGQCEHASVPEEDICLDSGDIISPEADVTGNDGAEYEAAGDNSDGTDDVVDTDIPALPTSHGDLEDYPLEVQWITCTPKYNLLPKACKPRRSSRCCITSGTVEGGYTTTVVSHHTMPGNFLLYGVEDVSGVDQGKHPASSLSARAIFNVLRQTCVVRQT